MNTTAILQDKPWSLMMFYSAQKNSFKVFYKTEHSQIQYEF